MIYIISAGTDTGCPRKNAIYQMLFPFKSIAFFRGHPVLANINGMNKIKIKAFLKKVKSLFGRRTIVGLSTNLAGV